MAYVWSSNLHLKVMTLKTNDIKLPTINSPQYILFPIWEFYEALFLLTSLLPLNLEDPGN